MGRQSQSEEVEGDISWNDYYMRFGTPRTNNSSDVIFYNYEVNDDDDDDHDDHEIFAFSNEEEDGKPTHLGLKTRSTRTSNNTACESGACGILYGSPTELSPSKIIRSELLNNVKLEVYLKIDQSLPDRVFCIDGGGVKGIVEAVMLRYIHYCLQRHHAGKDENILNDLRNFIGSDLVNIDQSFVEFEEVNLLKNQNDNTETIIEYDATAEPHIHKIFDIIAGTSTGSIIASALSRLYWNPDEILNTSKEIAPIVFPKPSKWNLYAKVKNSILSVLSLVFGCINKYSPIHLEKYLEEKFGRVTWNRENEDDKNESDPILGVITIREDDAQVHIFDSEIYKESNTVKIWEAVRASTAAPTYFPSHNITDDLHEVNMGKNIEEMKSFAFVDGGLSANCPANYTMSMLRGPEYQLACLISIGCGDDTPTYLPLKRVVQLAMNNEEGWNSFYRSHPREQPYLFRITPTKESGIGSFDLADSDKVDEIQQAYIKSLRDDEGSSKYLEEMVKSTTCLFAKSLRIVAANLRFDAIIEMYIFHLVIETRYNGKQYRYDGKTLKTGEPQILELDRDIDSLLPIKLQATLDVYRDIITIEYKGFEIIGSPIVVSRKITISEEEEEEEEEVNRTGKQISIITLEYQCEI